MGIAAVPCICSGWTFNSIHLILCLDAALLMQASINFLYFHFKVFISDRYGHFGDVREG